MSLFHRKGLLKTVSFCIQSQRFRGKINVQKPRVPHFEKALLLEFTKPYIPKPPERLQRETLCDHELKLEEARGKKEVNLLQQIIAREIRDKFNASQMVAFFHKNPMSAETEFKFYAAAHKHGMEYKVYGKETLQMAIQHTPYEAVLGLIMSHSAMLFSRETNAKKLLAINKKFPQLVLLAAIYENRFVNKDQFVKLSTIPSLQAAQSELVHTLSGVAGQLVSNLGMNQQILMQQLTERGQQLGEAREA